MEAAFNNTFFKNIWIVEQMVDMKLSLHNVSETQL